MAGSSRRSPRGPVYLVTFAWGGFGSSGVNVELIEAEGRGLVVAHGDGIGIDDGDFAILACLVDPRRRGVLAEYLPRMRRWLMGAAPADEIVNYVPDLISADVVRAMYSVCWEDVYPELDLPDQLDDPAARARLRQHLPAGLTVGGVIARLWALAKDDNRELTDDDWGMFKDVYFALVYDERA